MRRIIKTEIFPCPKGMRKLNHLASFLALIVVKDMESKEKRKNIFEKNKIKKKGKGIQRAVNLFRPGRFFLYSYSAISYISYSYIFPPGLCLSLSLACVYPAAAGQSTFARRSNLALNREMSKIEKTLDTQKLSFFFFLLIFLFIFFGHFYFFEIYFFPFYSAAARCPL
jgi:hypothetical protein